MRKAFAFLALLLAACAHGPKAEHPELVEVWTLEEGLRGPESVVYDARRNVLYVSNMAGKGDVRDGVGFISRVRADGRLDAAEWVAGFDSPKGLALAGDRLFASDIAMMIEIEVGAGRLVRRWPVEGATYLNDVTSDQAGRVIVSDARGHGLYQVDGETPRLFAMHPLVLRPNGVRLLDGDLVVLAGQPVETGDPGDERRLVRLKPDGTLAPVPSDRATFGHADGIEPDGRGGLFLSTNRTGEVIHIAKSGRVKTLLTLPTNATDLHHAVAQRRLYVPSAGGDSLRAYVVRWP